jgi:hypothetical protein
MDDQTITNDVGTTAGRIPTQPTAPSIENSSDSTPIPPKLRVTRKLWNSVRRNVQPLAAGFAAGLLTLGAIWGATAGAFGPGSFTLNGQMTLMQSSSYGSYSSSYSSSAYYLGQDGSCYGQGGYSDVGAGTAVNVYDQTGAIVAVGRLGAGNGSYSTGCTFSFSVPDVPGGSKFYQVEISHRGKMNLSTQDAKAGSAAYTLGGN